MIKSIRRSRKSVLGVALLALLIAGCGGDDEDKPSASTKPDSTVAPDRTSSTETETEATAPNPATETLPNDGDGTGTSPESGAGGAGDEVPARTLALFTGRDGAITPRLIRVPAFISVRVELRSADGAEYGLSFEGETIKVRDGLGSVATTIDGLRPGEKLVGTPTGATGSVRIEATAEPGP